MSVFGHFGRRKTLQLITGGMGFIGLHTAKAILDAGEDVVLTMWHTRREPDFIPPYLGNRAKVEVVDVINGTRSLKSVRNTTWMASFTLPCLVWAPSRAEYSRPTWTVS